MVWGTRFRGKYAGPSTAGFVDGIVKAGLWVAAPNITAARAPPHTSALDHRPAVRIGGVENCHEGNVREKVDMEMPPDAEARAPSRMCPKGLFIALNAGGTLGLSSKPRVPVTERDRRSASMGNKRVSKIFGMSRNGNTEKNAVRPRCTAR